jgi:hypothetical protein
VLPTRRARVRGVRQQLWLLRSLRVWDCMRVNNVFLQRAAAAGGAYVHGKGGTYWRPLFNAQGARCPKPTKTLNSKP